MNEEANSSPINLEQPIRLRPRRLVMGGWATIWIFWLVFSNVSTSLAQLSSHDASPEPEAGKAAGLRAINAAKEADIRKLLELTGAKKNAVEFGEQLGQYLDDMLQKSLPPGEHNREIGDTLLKKVAERLASDELFVRLAPVYDKAFTGDELQSIVQFYQTPAGRRLLDLTPDLMEEANSVCERWIKELIPQIMGQLREQFPELKQGAQ